MVSKASPFKKLEQLPLPCYPKQILVSALEYYDLEQGFISSMRPYWQDMGEHIGCDPVELAEVIHPRHPTFQIILNKIIQDIEDESCPRLLQGGREKYVIDELQVKWKGTRAATIYDGNKMDPCDMYDCNVVSVCLVAEGVAECHLYPAMYPYLEQCGLSDPLSGVLQPGMAFETTKR